MNPTLANRAPWLTLTCGTVALALSAFSTPASSEAPASEPAIVKVADDAGLAWGACPAFLPDGCAIAVLHGDPSKPNADVLFKVPAKAEIAPHTHTSAERMVLVAGEMSVTYEGQPAARLTPGSYAYGPAGRVHRATCTSEVPCVLFIAFESPVDAMPVGAAGR
jgi:quercetin dioxygenase-like cupin family protein